MKYIFLTVLALIAFAGNSILCRLALGEGGIDAGSFTTIRLLTGAIVLWAMVRFRKSHSAGSAQGSWLSPCMLFLYAVCFSYAYVSLETGTGALILFGAVQMTIILGSLFIGNRLIGVEWSGITVAFSGFIYLMLPGVNTPPVSGFLLMFIAGAAWGVYSLLGKGSINPLMDTATNFIRTVPFVLMLTMVTLSRTNISMEGVILAMLSGGLASGIGYTLWYMALEGITTTQSAVVQLFVPVIAAFAGVLFANEVLTLRLVLASGLILSGILMTIVGRYYFNQKILNKT